MGQNLYFDNYNAAGEKRCINTDTDSRAQGFLFKDSLSGGSSL